MINQAFGDSITVGTNGTSSYSKSWLGRMTPTNSAINGSMAGDLSMKLHGNYYPTAATPIVASASETYSIMVGTNDIYFYKNDATKKEYFRKFLRASIAWLCLPTKVLPGSMTLTGSWTASLPNLYTCTTQNSTAQTTVSGTTVYVGYQLQNYANTSSLAEIRIDGVLVDTLTANSPGMDTMNGYFYAIGCKRYSGLSSGTHTVNVKIVSATGQYFYLSYIAGSDQPSSKVLVSNIIERSASAYSTYGLTPAVTTAYNTIVSDVVGEFVADGKNVILVDNHASVLVTDLASDGIHMLDSGHAKVSANFAAAM